jgi:hypothetical protein
MLQEKEENVDGRVIGKGNAACLPNKCRRESGKSGEKVTGLTALWSVFLRRVGEDDALGWEEWSRDRRGCSWMESMLAFCECGVKVGNGMGRKCKCEYEQRRG